jgi:prophage regulatory protein
MNTAPTKPQDRFLRLPEVRSTVGVCRTTLWNWISAGNFPAPHKLGTRSVGWLESDIQNWITSRTRGQA